MLKISSPYAEALALWMPLKCVFNYLRLWKFQEKYFCFFIYYLCIISLPSGSFSGFIYTDSRNGIWIAYIGISRGLCHLFDQMWLGTSTERWTAYLNVWYNSWLAYISMQNTTVQIRFRVYKDCRCSTHMCITIASKYHTKRFGWCFVIISYFIS